MDTSLGTCNIENPSVCNVGPKPTARLISWTPYPLEFMWHVWTHAKVGDNANIPRQELAIGETNVRLTPSRVTLVEWFHSFIRDWTPIPAMVQFTFQLNNVPVALLNQLVRHELGTVMFVRSWRVQPPTDFGTEDEYFVPDSIAADRLALSRYRVCMDVIEETYDALLEAGIRAEDARGVLPMHTMYTLVWSVNLRSFVGLVQKRTCLLLQQQYWAPLLSDMRKELVQRVDSEFEYLFMPPCKFRDACISPTEQQLRVTGEDLNEPCPLYVEKWGDGTAPVV